MLLVLVFGGTLVALVGGIVTNTLDQQRLSVSLDFPLPAKVAAPPGLDGKWDVYAPAEVAARRLTPAVTGALAAVTASGVETMLTASGRALELRVLGGTSAPEQVFALVDVCRAFTQP